MNCQVREDFTNRAFFTALILALMIGSVWTSLQQIVTSEEQFHRYLCYGLISYAASVFASSVVIAAPYGRYHDQKTKVWGPCIPAAIGWVVQESPAFLVFAYLGLYHSRADLCGNLTHQLLSAMFLWHYLYRSFIYPLFIRGKPTPLTVVLLAFLFCVTNGYVQVPKPSSWLIDPRFIGGSLIWGIGWFINFQSDHILRQLRRKSTDGYQIPRGGMFEYVSAANYFGEIFEWFGWAVANWSLPAFSFAFFAFCFLSTRGYQHHKWYLNKFKGEYPKNRKAIIPFLW